MESIQQREVRYNGVHCQIAIQWFSRQIVLLKITGTDVGEFSSAPMLELDRQLVSIGPVKLFIDARSVRAASIDVSGDWANWLGSHRQSLSEVHMLTGSRFIQITANFVRRFAEIQDIMNVYSNPTDFEDELTRALNQDS